MAILKVLSERYIENFQCTQMVPKASFQLYKHNTHSHTHFSMASYIVITLALVVSYANGVIDKSSECSTLWSYRPPGSSKCKCGQSLDGGVMCLDDRVYLRVDYTMTVTTNHSDHHVIVALSDYGYDNHSTLKNRVYTLLSNNSEDLNKVLCRPNNREGFLCEDCIKDYGPTSKPSKCANCKENLFVKRMAFYLALKLFPITFLFFLISLFQLNITQGYLFGYIIFCQGHSITARIMTQFYQLILTEVHNYKWILDGSLFISSFWVMDYTHFFGDFCISSSLDSLNIYYLNYISVLYPLLLMLISYFFIELHARNFRPVIYIWKPFSVCFAKIRRLNATDSIIHAYATLLILSFSTLNFNSYQLLKVTNVYYSNGTQTIGVLYHRPSILTYTYQHLIQYSLVMVLLFVLGIIPTLLLCIHSIKMLRQKLNNCFSQRTQIAINTFVNTIQATFRDKYRILPAICALIIILLTIIGTFGHSVSLYILPLFSPILAIAATVIAYARPCVSSTTNISLSFHLLWMAAIGNALTGYVVAISAINTAKLFVIMLPVPHVLVLLWVSYEILQRIGFIDMVFNRVKRRLQTKHQNSYENLLPDRLVNSINYREPVLSACK